jgi:hypothetical protein
MGKMHPFPAVLLILIAWPAQAADAGLKDDAYHFMRGVDDDLYNEWWYFNGISSDTQFLVSYFLSDPENASGRRRIQTLAAVLDGSPVVALHQSGGFMADQKNPEVDLGRSGFRALNGSAYRIWGRAEDILTGRPVEWDLTYLAALDPWFPTPVQVRVGHIPKGWMKWLVYMPSARVSGTLTVNGQTRKISAVGYHDHNWGRWAFNDPQWNWAQVSRPSDGFSLCLGDVIGGERTTALGVKYAGRTIKFSGKQVRLSYEDPFLDPLAARMCPRAYKVEAESGEDKLTLEIKVQKSLALPVSYPWPQPSYVIFEQLSRFNGTLRSKGLIYPFEETGFSEYTVHRLHPIFGRVNAPDLRNTTATARNERSGESKMAELNSTGWFSVDADYADYLANSTAPWVRDGDRVRLEVRDSSGRRISTALTVEIAQEGQDVGLMELR